MKAGEIQTGYERGKEYFGMVNREDGNKKRKWAPV
jgi:hypothetical protein